MFLAREKELDELRRFLESKDSRAALVYGKRRVGKSSLILEAVRGMENVLYFECLDASVERNIKALSERLRTDLSMPSVTAPDLFAFFDNLKAFGRPFIVILDEYHNLRMNSDEGNMDSFMQSIIDSLGKSGMKIILSGSYVSLMKSLLERDNPLFGRFQAIIHLRELDYYDSSLFYPSRSVRDKVAFFSVFGGSPYALSSLSASTLKENIMELLLKENGILRSYLEYTLFAELRKAQAANEILDIIGNSKKRFGEISDSTGALSSANVNRQLQLLLRMDVLERTTPINAPSERKTFYSISDNLVRFYYAYVFHSRDTLNRIGPEMFYELYIEPSLDTFISYRTEGIARSYFERLARRGLLKGVYDIGVYWYDDRKRRKNGEFDCVLKCRDGYDVYEVKNLSSPMTPDMMREEIMKIRGIEGLDVRRIGFVSISGFEEEMDDVITISGEDLYSEALE